MIDPDLPPEATNREQDDEGAQAQTVSLDALDPDYSDPLASEKRRGALDDDSSQDLVDHMRDMETSGRIDMDAFRGEPNMDDNPGKYGPGHDAEFEDDDS